MKRAAFFLPVILTLISSLSMFIGCSDEPVGPGDSVGRIGIYPKPAGVDFVWSLNGPNGYALTDTGDFVLNDMKVGDYTISWRDKLSWITPTDSVVTKSLKSGEFLSFSTTYLDIGGAAGDKEIKIVISPPELLAHWTLKGPSDFVDEGDGTNVFFNMAYGVYTINWREVPGYDLSGDSVVTQEMLEGSGLTFSALYENSVASEIKMTKIYTDKVLKMGANDELAQKLKNEGPRHLVHLTNDFLMSESEITWAQYERIMAGANPSTGGCPSGAVCSSLPVESISWLQAAIFCNEATDFYNLDETVKRLVPCYEISGGSVIWNRSANGFRLPTEAEWEYACADSIYSLHRFVDESSSCYSDSYLDMMGWYCDNASWPPDSDAGAPRPHAAKSLLPSANGLYDMHGNVWEWVWDYNVPYDAFSVNVIELWVNDTDFEITGSATIVDGLGETNAGALSLNGCSVNLNVSGLGVTSSRVEFDIIYYEALTNLQVNDDTMYWGDLSQAPADIAPSVYFEITALEGEVGPEKLCRVVITGDVEKLVIGGRYLMIDNILIVDSDPSEYALDRGIDFETSARGSYYRYDPSTAALFGCTVTDPIGPATGGEHMLRGGSYLNAPKYCRATTRSSTISKAYSLVGFRIVRNLD